MTYLRLYNFNQTRRRNYESESNRHAYERRSPGTRILGFNPILPPKEGLHDTQADQSLTYTTKNVRVILKITTTFFGIRAQPTPIRASVVSKGAEAFVLRPVHIFGIFLPSQGCRCTPTSLRRIRGELTSYMAFTLLQTPPAVGFSGKRHGSGRRGETPAAARKTGQRLHSNKTTHWP